MRIENIENSNYCTDGKVLFDTSSQRSFVTESVRKKLKLPTLRKETMIFQVFGQNDNKVKEVDIVQIKIKGNNGLYIFIEAVSCPKICSPITNQRYNFAKNNYDHLRNIKLLKYSEGDSTSIDLLIRNDFCYSFINWNIAKGQKDEPIAIETYLGGFIDKNINKESSINFNSTHVLRLTVEDNFINDYKEEKRAYQDELKCQLNKFWQTEGVGLNDYIEDDKFMKRFIEN